MTTDLYDSLAELYDLMISWKQRLRRERPFLTRVFKEFHVRRVLDAATGTGMHAIAFHKWGYHVVGADINARMVEKALENSDVPVEFVEAGFADLDKVGVFDAVTCLGNSLQHVLTDADLDESLQSMLNALLPGGVLIIHGNNYDRIVGRRERFMPLARATRGGRHYLFMRFFDFHDDLLRFNVVTMMRHAGEWQMIPGSSTHRALTHDLLVDRLKAVGFEDISAYGSFAGEEFEWLDSDNLIVVARKPHDCISRPVAETIAALDRVSVRENGESLVEVSESASGIETREESTFARQRVVDMLKVAQSMLPDGHRLIVKTVCRSLERQRELYEGYYNQLAEQHPDWPASQLRRTVNRFLAPPDAAHPPGHTTGGAVDLSIIGPDGEELDMASTIRPVENILSTFPTYSRLITPTAARNRRMLVDVMLAAGFSNYPGEWWHWSYGDSAWALRTGAPFAPYAAIEECPTAKGSP